jgi:hypothetical protein
MTALHDGWVRYIASFGGSAAVAIACFVAFGRLRRGAR